MISQRNLFLQYIGQTSEMPLSLEIERAEGIYLYDRFGKKYIDLVSGVSVSNVGHCHPKVVEAVKKQAETYMHLMVYGEYVQEPQVKFAKKIIEELKTNLESVYFVNSGSEAIEGALKLAKRYTGRQEIIACKKAYHGSTHGALSIYGGEELKKAVKPLLPKVKFIEFNTLKDLEVLSKDTACVVVEVIQGEAGIVAATTDFLQKLRKKCNELGILLIFDEIQTGFGRTGKFFAFQHYNITPDILCVAKAMGGGMPIGAFIAPKKIMDTLTHNPVLGHITTFGGHPVSCAAGLAALNVLIDEKLCEKANEKGKYIVEKLKSHHCIDHIRGKGLFLAVELTSQYSVEELKNKCLENGLVFDPFLFDNKAFRIAPPLTITLEEIDEMVEKLEYCLDNI